MFYIEICSLLTGRSIDKAIEENEETKALFCDI